jgi:two-component system cell cycle sensor histidine kinase/response regulator CckA
MSKIPNKPVPPSGDARPPNSEATEAGGWKAAAQSQRLLHELRVHQIELEMQNEELRVSRAEVESGLKRYTDLYDFAPVGYLTLSAEGTISELNLPAARLLGRERSRLVGGQLRTFVDQASRRTFDAWLSKAFAGPDKQSCELVLLRDRLPPVHVAIEVALSEDARAGRAVLVDISTRKALEDELRQAQKMDVVGQLAGGVAHDFNNILAAMMLNLGQLRAENPALSETEGAWHDLNELTQRAGSLTSQLLAFGRRQVMQPQQVELNAAVTHLLKMIERLLGEDVTCVFRAGTPELWVEADVTMLEQAVLNLCLNARDAMPNGGTLTLETGLAELSPDDPALASDPKSRPGRFASLRVSDTGCGMAPGVLAHAFEPFFTTKEVGKGTGLGLSSVYGTVAQHSGWLNVESVLDVGSTFTLFLPLTVRQGSYPAPAAKSEPAKGTGETILLVEDEAAVLAVSTRVLSRLGYKVLAAADARQALALAERHGDTIDLVLTDMRMPGGMNGLTLAAQLREHRPSIKVIIMSGYNSDMVLGGPAGSVQFTYLAKPFELKILAETVRRCLDF